ncbi:MAG TPA: PucR family transcriptional regulator ligand-binding domain-containing protein [Solirubrobacteraceae bacterium]|jgi:purine catabolism regulator
MLTVSELISDLDVEVLAGEAALDAPVRWVHISELADPTPWLSGGELLLTTGLPLGDAQAQRAYVKRLAEHGLAGLGFGLGFAHDTVPEALVEAAAARDFPLFSIPYELPFIAVTEQAFTRLVNEQYALLRRSIAAQERLQRVVLAERGLDGLVGALAGLVGGAALILDARGVPLAQRTFRRPLEDDLVEALGAEARERTRRSDAQPFVPSAGDLAPRALALPVAAAGRRSPQAWLIAVKDAGGLGEVDRLVLHQAATVVALELLRRRVADTTERRLAGDVLAALVNGELTGPDLLRRLEPFGLDDAVCGLVLAPVDDRRRPELEPALAAALRDEAVPALVALDDTRTCALVPGMGDDELFDLGERARARVSAEAGVPVMAGAGRTVAAADARRTLHEARCALEARALGAVNGGALATYRDLGSFQLLLSLQDHEALGLFCDSLLGPIEAGEGQYGGELVRSLEAFIECNGQWERAAQRLFCHRHTLRYRIRRIEELTGRDLGNARDRIEFWLALRGKEIATR